MAPPQSASQAAVKRWRSSRKAVTDPSSFVSASGNEEGEGDRDGGDAAPQALQRMASEAPVAGADREEEEEEGEKGEGEE